MFNRKAKEIELLKEYNNLIQNDIRAIRIILNNNHLLLDTEYGMETDFSVHRKAVEEIKLYLKEESEKGKGERIREQLEVLRKKEQLFSSLLAYINFLDNTL